MTPVSTSPSPKRIMFVEGFTDKHVVRHICRQNELPCFPIEEKQGVHVLLEDIGPEIKAPDREVVAFVLDANGDIKKQWCSVYNELKKAGVTPPKKPASAGVIVAGQPRVGVWLMPDNESLGELEDFVQTMIPEGDPVWPLSKQYIADIPEEHKKFKLQKTSKAEVYAWIATRKKPAIGTRDLDTSGDLCLRFSTWIRKLFG